MKIHDDVSESGYAFGTSLIFLEVLLLASEQRTTIGHEDYLLHNYECAGVDWRVAAVEEV